MCSIRVGSFAAAIAISLACPTATYASGDAAAGKQHSLACAACHVTNDPASDTPRLSGQHERYLAEQLQAFKRGDRANPLMNTVARQLSSADIDDLAAFWSKQPAGSDIKAPDGVAAIRTSHMTFPRDFPNGFVLYLTSSIAEHNTIKRTYINTLGFEAARTNKPLPDGSAVIVVNYAARLDAAGRPVLDKDGSWVADQITSYSGMEARAGWGAAIPEVLRNANWNYSAFTADKKPRGDTNQAACLACHKQQAVVNFLFTFRELDDKASAK